MMENKNQRECSIGVYAIDSNPDFPLTEGEFQSLKHAKNCLNAAMALEENFDLLINNYRDLELEAISASVNDMTTGMPDYDDFFDVRTRLNRRVINLLSATRMYMDQCPQLLKKIGAEPKEAKEVSSKAYDDAFEYRFMEALRNHVQHAGLAVHGVTMGKSWLPAEAPEKMQFSITPYASRSVLEESSGFKRTVLDECPDQVGIISAARIHVGGISSVHRKARELIDPFVHEARRLFQDTIARHEGEADNRCLGLFAIAREDGEIVEKISILLDWDDIRQNLVRKNHPIENLGRRFVTSEAKGGAV